ncbi:MAG: ribosome biogenesis GTP-binding protein YihA/YsxC [Myxococcaceae bacterium]
MIQVLDARFVATAVDPAGYPKGELPEVAFVGRSNVGKSSMINTLAARRKLVRVSNTPGRTKTLNFFEVDLSQDKVKRTLRLADLPGYGFAKASKTERAQWKTMIDAYLSERKLLKAVVSIVDGEIGPSEEDRQMIDYLQEKDRRILVVATKIDRLTKARRKPQVQKIARDLEVPLEVVVPFSSTDKIGVDEVWEALLSVTA